MKNKPEFLILVIALLATAAKLYCAATTLGAIDVLLFEGLARYISMHGVIDLYMHNRIFNHPPILGDYIGLTWDMAGGNEQKLAFFTRLPGIIADLAVVILVLWIRRQTGRPPWWAIALLAASPVSFMISGYHGNYDPLIPLGLVLVAAACLQRKALLAGVLLGLACQVKIIPLVMSPVLFFYWFHRGKAGVFTTATIATLLLGWLAPLLAVPEVFARQVLAYSSIWGWWGITYLLNISGLPNLGGVVSIQPLSHSQILVVQVLKSFWLSAGRSTLAWRRRKEEAVELLATMGLVWALFFTFAPGFGVQYLAWVSPSCLYYSSRWFTAFTTTGSVALFIFYNTISRGMPWQKGFGLEKTLDQWAPWMLLPWLVFAAMVIAGRKEFGLGIRAAEAEPSPNTPVETTVALTASPCAEP